MRAAIIIGLWIVAISSRAAGLHAAAPSERADPRNIKTGLTIPDEGYCDQPYVVVTRDGNWLCTLTTGPGREGQRGQHVVSTISTDRGKTWSELVDIEPSDGPEASWAVPLVVPSGRVYCFYTYNGDRIDTLRGRKIRADMLGWYCYKYSDDNGRSWSKQRYRLPMRVTACDRTNDWQGRVVIFWGICKPFAFRQGVFFSFTKLGRYMLEDGEGWLFRSDNILSQSDPASIDWQMLPEGEHGIRNEKFGSVQEEHNLVPLSDGTLYCVYRTTTGYPCHTYSRDGGRTWEKPVQMTYTPGGRRIKNPRACPKVWRCSNGKYLFWFHNHSGRSFQGRNPAWIAGGVERNGRIYWSQPEILLYDDDPDVRISYPDLIEQNSRYWVTETQKTIARVHQIDPGLLEGLWRQGEWRQVARRGLVVELLRPEQVVGGQVALPEKLDVSAGGLAVELWVRFEDLAAGQVLLDTRGSVGAGFVLSTTEKAALRLELHDGQNGAAWDCDPGVLRPGVLHHVVAIVDSGPKIITFVVDGRLCDGGEHRQYGWGRYQGNLGDVGGSGRLRLGPAFHGKLVCVRIYDRYLRTSEAVANYRAGCRPGR